MFRAAGKFLDGKFRFIYIVFYNGDGFFYQLLVKGVMVMRLGSIFISD